MFETHNSVTNFFRSLERFIGNFAFFCAFVSTGYMRTTRNFLCANMSSCFLQNLCAGHSRQTVSLHATKPAQLIENLSGLRRKSYLCNLRII